VSPEVTQYPNPLTYYDSQGYHCCTGRLARSVAAISWISTAAHEKGFLVLLARVNTVQGEVDKLTSGNETLQMYVDNLAKQLAASKK
jgi:hypothetical protein